MSSTRTPEVESGRPGRQRARIVVLAGGAWPEPDVLPDWIPAANQGEKSTPPSDVPPLIYTIAADSGADFARARGIAVDLVVGDLDSISADGLAWAEGQGARIERHPPRKDQSDLELALARAAEIAVSLDQPATGHAVEVLVLGLGGGRLDHWVTNILVLAGPLTKGLDVRGIVGRDRIRVVRDRTELRGRVGELVSLVPVGGPARGVTTEGLAYGLDAEDLEAGTARGLSNYFDRSSSRRHSDGTVTATVTLTSGVLLVIQPNPQGYEVAR